ncbi:MAG: NADH-quinone oxidoreductase subunit J [Fimbriiglobus sp.]
MNSLFALAPITPFAAIQVLGAVVLGAIGVSLLLPRPRGRQVALGTFLTIASAVVAFGFLVTTFGGSLSTESIPALVEQGLFWFFTAGAVGFGAILVTQANPARGAMAFAFVILSTCGLFLLLAAPFLMAATIIIYAGAIIVTFLFVLMLSNAKGPSDENDRSREPFLGSLAGFAFAGLVFLTLSLGIKAKAPDDTENLQPAFAIRSEDKTNLLTAAQELLEASQANTADDKMLALTRSARNRIIAVVGPAPGEFGEVAVTRAVQDRVRFSETDFRTRQIILQADDLRMLKKTTTIMVEDALLKPQSDRKPVKEQILKLRGETLKLAGRGELSAKNVTAIGYSLYSEYLIAVEMAGTLLLVATIGAVAIANRKGASA